MSRLFVSTRNPGKLIALDSDSGEFVTSLPCVAENDDMAYELGKKHLYVAGSEFVYVFQQIDADVQVLGAFHAQTVVPIPELNRY